MSHSNAYTTLRAALEETDELARAGDAVGYESAYRILRRAVAQMLEGGHAWHRSGEKAPASGIYATDEIRQPGQRYYDVAGGREVALTKGERFPPSPFPWWLVQEARRVS